VYVRPFPGPGGKWQISNTGGQLPVWSPNGRELFFQNPDNRIMVADYQTKSESFVPGRPRVWSDQQLHDVNGLLNYDLAPDGKRFAVFTASQSPEGKSAAQITLLVELL
jgi:serine/threonine-protein kinase